MGATERKPLGREVENNLVEVAQCALEILSVRLGAVAVPAVDGAFVQRHRRSSQRLLSRFQESPTYPCRLLRLVRRTSWRVARLPLVSLVTG